MESKSSFVHARIGIMKRRNRRILRTKKDLKFFLLGVESYACLFGSLTLTHSNFNNKFTELLCILIELNLCQEKLSQTCGKCQGRNSKSFFILNILKRKYFWSNMLRKWFTFEPKISIELMFDNWPLEIADLFRWFFTAWIFTNKKNLFKSSKLMPFFMVKNFSFQIH